jgi:hypothetical protein
MTGEVGFPTHPARWAPLFIEGSFRNRRVEDGVLLFFISVSLCEIFRGSREGPSELGPYGGKNTWVCGDGGGRSKSAPLRGWMAEGGRQTTDGGGRWTVDGGRFAFCAFCAFLRPCLLLSAARSGVRALPGCAARPENEPYLKARPAGTRDLHRSARSGVCALP